MPTRKFPVNLIAGSFFGSAHPKGPENGNRIHGLPLNDFGGVTMGLLLRAGHSQTHPTAASSTEMGPAK
jgi:hypothetical protein